MVTNLTTSLKTLAEMVLPHLENLREQLPQLRQRFDVLGGSRILE
jgi:hypothetical protein